MLDQKFLTTLFEMKHSLINKIDKLEDVKYSDSEISSIKHQCQIDGRIQELERVNRVINAYFDTQEN